jgi:hypothetical protein
MLLERFKDLFLRFNYIHTIITSKNRKRTLKTGLKPMKKLLMLVLEELKTSEMFIHLAGTSLIPI